MKKFLTAILFAPVLAFAAGATLHLDSAPDRSSDMAALQNGAKLFVNYCLNCHSASYMRYNRLQGHRPDRQQIKDNLMFTAEKVGEPMKIAMRAPTSQGLVRRGAAGSDHDRPGPRLRARQRRRLAVHLSAHLLSRRESPDRLEQRVFENVGMPHVLWELQGEQVMGADHKLTLAKPGKMTPQEYDAMVGDLVAFIKSGWASRRRIPQAARRGRADFPWRPLRLCLRAETRVLERHPLTPY
jgi:ubiquinol-cytochrome c reductase cytochrome c1 subunit